MNSIEKDICGYITRIQNINDIDQILTIISKDYIYNLYANGTLKPNSKNSKFISLGSFINCSIFFNNMPDKLSKLKKITNSKKNEYEEYWINHYYKKFLILISNFSRKSNYLYDLLINYINMVNNGNVLELWLWTLARITKDNGHAPIVNKCSDCSIQSPIYSFELQGGGLKCYKHAYKRNKKQLIEEIVQYIWLFDLDFLEYFKKSNKLILPTQERNLYEFMNNHMGIYI